MNKQIKFQKILAFISLVVAALTFVFAIIFLSGNLAYNSGNGMGGILTYHSKYEYGFDSADKFIDTAQMFVGALVVIAIIYIIAAASLFITASHTRRNYYVTNYISIGLNIAMSLFIGLFILIFMFVLMGFFYGTIDWAGLSEVIAREKLNGNDLPEVTKSPVMFIIGIVIALIVLANGVFWALNLIWKIKLMKGEKQLLEKGFVKEVA